MTSVTWSPRCRARPRITNPRPCPRTTAPWLPSVRPLSASGAKGETAEKGVQCPRKGRWGQMVGLKFAWGDLLNVGHLVWGVEIWMVSTSMLRHKVL